MQAFWDFISDEGNNRALNLLWVVGAAIIGAIYLVWPRKKVTKDATSSQTVSDKSDTPKQDNAEALKAKDDFIVDLKSRIKAVEAELETAKSEKEVNKDKAHLLELELVELKTRLANPDKALAEAQATIALLREQLDRSGNMIDPSILKAARQALEDQDWLEVERQYGIIQADAEQNIAAQKSLAAEAAYARGLAAEQAVNWAGAYAHYARAAELDTTAEHLNLASEFAWRMGDYDKALQYGAAYMQAIADRDGKTHANYAVALNNQAVHFRNLGRYAEAEPLYRQALEIGKKTLGEDHPEYAVWLNNLAGLLRTTGRYVEAELLYRQAGEIAKKTLGEDHPDYAIDLNNLAGLLCATGRYAEAEPLYRQAGEITKKTLGEDHPDYAIDLNNLAGLLEATGRYAEAEPLYRQAGEITKNTLGEGHPSYAIRLNNLAGLLKDTGRYAEAEPLYRQAGEITKKTLGEDHPDYAIDLNNLAGLLRATGRYAEAEPLYRQAGEITKKTLGEDHPDYAIDLNNLAGLLRTTGRYAEAEPLFRQAIEISEAGLGADHPQTVTIRENYEIFQTERE